MLMPQKVYKVYIQQWIYLLGDKGACAIRKGGVMIQKGLILIVVHTVSQFYV